LKRVNIDIVDLGRHALVSVYKRKAILPFQPIMPKTTGLIVRQ